ncbi:MAG: hypothetical protein IRZ00_17450, partial [Gemmatimonadetes bacterium]|nr:hypothetical protein [Gemmatimonadota bacterium]
MSLRLKVLLLFVGLAIAPILAVGLIDFALSLKDIDQLVAARLAAGAERAARQIEARFTALEVGVVELAGSASVRRLVAGADDGAAEVAADLRARWPKLARDLESLEVRDAAGAVVFRTADAGGGPGAP